MFSLCWCRGRYLWRQEEVAEPLKLDLNVLVSHLLWGWGTELRASRRAASTLMAELPL